MDADPPPVGGSSFRICGSSDEEDDTGRRAVTSPPDPAVPGVDDCTRNKNTGIFTTFRVTTRKQVSEWIVG